ncbi:MAG TPA: hypothetical protein VFC51_10660 [Chloroflexota bacterium]|nr:hypothetical protein [Chloroflexota bacterium]
MDGNRKKQSHANSQRRHRRRGGGQQRIRDGKIVEHWGNSDVLGMLQQLG